jgi:hypothetical protein
MCAADDLRGRHDQPRAVAAARFGSASAAQAAAVESWSAVLAGMGDVAHVPMTSGGTVALKGPGCVATVTG